jgi:hypothetical protein
VIFQLTARISSGASTAADGGRGVPPKVVQERLGHSSVMMTLEVYGHLFPRGDEAEELYAAERAFLRLVHFDQMLVQDRDFPVAAVADANIGEFGLRLVEAQGSPAAPNSVYRRG